MNLTSKKAVILVALTITLNSCGGNEEKAGYFGENISNDIEIIRDPIDKRAYIDLKKDIEWKLYAGYNTNNINFSEEIAQGEKQGKYLIEIHTTQKEFFQVITPKGGAILTEKLLPMSGGYNFRDLGGLRNKDKKYVKWGKVFRSDDLGSLTDEDLDYLSSIPIYSIVDFRSTKEIKELPSRIPPSVKEIFNLSISPGDILELQSLSKLSEEEARQIMRKLNVVLVSDSTSIKQYQTFFQLLQEDKTPLIFHCSAGKDRTGMAAALFLFSLGIDEDVIIKDYLGSNRHLKNKYKPISERMPSLKPLMVVDSDYIKEGINYLKDKYGSVDNYLTQVLNVDINKMKKLYLYP